MLSKSDQFSQTAKQTQSNRKFSDVEPYNELINSISEEERDAVIAELNSETIIKRAQLLTSELAENKLIGLKTDESRTLFLAALKNLREKKISVNQLATLHILDAAIRTLYTNPMAYLIYLYVKNDGNLERSIQVFPIEEITDMPTSVRRVQYDRLGLPDNVAVDHQTSPRMQKPLMQRYFHFSDAEWNMFCAEMAKAPKTEQEFHILVAPEAGCWSGIISRIQKVLKCMRVIDWFVATNDGLTLEDIMLVPSFTMFQAAINAKAHTLHRKPVELIPTYGYIESEHYAELKSSGKIAMALYLPERNSSIRYKNFVGNFRTTIDGHYGETAFAGTIHDIYHALREMAMTENVAKARMRLASIAKAHPKNKRNSMSRAVDDILIDGELIYSYPPELDTIFSPKFRPSKKQSFGDLFYVSTLSSALDEDLKRAFIEDMVVNHKLWQEEFQLSRSDLNSQEQIIFDAIAATKHVDLSLNQSTGNIDLNDSDDDDLNIETAKNEPLFFASSEPLLQKAGLSTFFASPQKIQAAAQSSRKKENFSQILSKIKTLEEYGLELNNSGHNRGASAIILAGNLKCQISRYLEDQIDKEEANREIRTLMQQGKLAMGEDRRGLDILAHIFIALTGIGFAFMVVQKVQKGTFFLNKTKRETLLSSLEEEEFIKKSLANN